MTHPIVVTDMDGTLATADTWRGVLAWIKANHPSPAADGFVRARIPRIVVAKVFRRDKETFKARWMVDQAALLAGLTREDVAAMGAWVVDEWLWPARRQGALDAARAAADEARAANPAARLVLASGGYQEIADAFAARIGADVALGTPLEYVDGIATGRVAAPIQTGAQKAAAVRALAEGGEVVAAFGDSQPDIPLLAMARRAVAVAPDPQLRREAAARGWELLEG